jgi:hypothetical protein
MRLSDRLDSSQPSTLPLPVLVSWIACPARLLCPVPRAAAARAGIQPPNPSLELPSTVGKWRPVSDHAEPSGRCRLVARLAEVRRPDRDLEGASAGHRYWPVRGVGVDHRDIADQVADPTQPVEVEHHPIAAPMGGGTNLEELGSDGGGDDLLGAGAPRIGRQHRPDPGWSARSRVAPWWSSRCRLGWWLRGLRCWPEVVRLSIFPVD